MNTRIRWGDVKNEEWRWVLLAAWLVMMLSSLPYIAGYAAGSSEMVFNGAVVDRQDYAVHLSTMHLGARGEWAYRMRFTSEVQDGAYIKMGYLFLGHASRWLGTSLPATYHLARLLFGVFACVGIYALAAQCFAEVFWRRTVFILAVLGSGLSWLQLLTGMLPVGDISPIDFWLIDGYVFFGFLAFPHFSAVTALLAAMLVCGMTYLHRGTWLNWLFAALAGVVVQLIQPYAPVLADAGLLGMFAAAWLQQRRIRGREVVFIMGLGLVQAPLLAYNALVLNADPLWRGFVEQNITLSPPPIYYLWGYGIFWLLGILGVITLVIRMLRSPVQEVHSAALPALAGALFWAAAALLLAYSPGNLQRRFMHAYTIPLALLAAAGLKAAISPWMARAVPGRIARRGALVVAPVLVLASISSLLLGLGNSLNMLKRPQALFDPSQLVRAVDWLGVHTGPDDVVLSAEQSGQLAAARTGMPVYLGHPIETLDYAEKTRRVGTLFRGEDPGDWLADSGVDWVVSGPYEQKLGPGINPPASLVLVYEHEGVLIYKVKP